MSLNLRAQRSASSLLVMMSVVGCKLTSPLDEVDTQLHPAPNGTGGTANNGGTNNGGTNNTGGTANNGGNDTGGTANASCPVCNISSFDCTVDGANPGQAIIVDVTADGCTGTIGTTSATSPMWINCDDDQVCVGQEDTCFDATFDADGFSYQITGGGTAICSEANTALPNCDEVELLVDGSFDDGSGAWIETSSNGFPLVQDAASLGAVPPHSGSFAAWLGGFEFEESSLAQQVFIPDGTVSITASGFYGVTSTDPGLDDFATISIGSDESGIAIGLQSWDPRNAVDPWVPFSGMTDGAELAGLTLFFLIRSTTDGAENTNFFFDSLSLTATVCPDGDGSEPR